MSEVAHYGVTVVCNGAGTHPEIRLAKLRAEGLRSIGGHATQRSRNDRTEWLITCPHRPCRQKSVLRDDVAIRAYDFIAAHPGLMRAFGHPRNIGNTALDIRLLNEIDANLRARPVSSTPTD